jgi:hypothetical protein
MNLADALRLVDETAEAGDHVDEDYADRRLLLDDTLALLAASGHDPSRVRAELRDVLLQTELQSVDVKARAVFRDIERQIAPHRQKVIDGLQAIIALHVDIRDVLGPSDVVRDRLLKEVDSVDAASDLRPLLEASDDEWPSVDTYIAALMLLTSANDNERDPLVAPASRKGNKRGNPTSAVLKYAHARLSAIGVPKEHHRPLLEGVGLLPYTRSPQ